MTRTLPFRPSIPLFIVAAVALASLAFGITRYLTDGTQTLPPLAVATDTAASSPDAMNRTRLYAARIASVVDVTATVDGHEPLDGAGFVVDQQGTIVTASHVVKEAGLEARTIVVSFKNGDEVPATIAALDQFNDIAILRIDPAEVSQPLVVAPLGNSDAVAIGAPVASIGSPYGHQFSITGGYVSNTHVVVNSQINRAYSIPDMLQFDAPLNPGNSGGAVFDARGQVVGMAQQIASESHSASGVSFAVSSNLVRHSLDVWRTTGARNLQPADLGVTTRTVSAQLATQARLGTPRGVLVQSTRPGGPAQQAQLAVGQTISFHGQPVVLGSQIVSVNGQAIHASEEFERLIAFATPGSSLRIGVADADGHVSERTITPTVRPIV